MSELRELGFRNPAYSTHKSGMILYYGTYGNNDWGVAIPSYLVNRVCGRNTTTKAFEFYDVSYDMALAIIKKYLKGWVNYAEVNTNTNRYNKYGNCNESVHADKKHTSRRVCNPRHRRSWEWIISFCGF